MAEADTSTLLLPTQQTKYRSRSQKMIRNVSILDILTQKAVTNRFWRKVAVSDPSSCWLWTGAAWQCGYGKMYLPGPIPFGAHRASWILDNQKDQPADMFVCHHCDVKRCVNPSHLYLGTPLENSRDAVDRGLCPNGSRQGSSKLVEADIPEIRRLQAGGMFMTEIAKLYGVSNGTIQQIIKGNYWKQVPR